MGEPICGAAGIIAATLDAMCENVVDHLSDGRGRSLTAQGRSLFEQKVVDRIHLGQTWPCSIRITIRVDRWDAPEAQESRSG